MDSKAEARYKKLKLTAILICGLWFLLIVGFGMWKENIPPWLCTICHSMNPEYYTWKESSHNQVDCNVCHIPPGAKNFMKYKLRGFKEVFYTITNTYPAPIKILKPVEDSSCERCHNMKNRYATPSGDLIIPHDVHKKEEIRCSKCHSGLVHGNIDDRSATYKTDYDKWDSKLAQALMSEPKFIQPDMDVCLRCHKVRKAPLDCDACHTTSMLPEDHNNPDFMDGHGAAAATALKYCQTCHGLMSDEKIEGFKEVPTYLRYADPEKYKEKPVSVLYYAKTNTFCKDCHSKRPPSHQGDFMKNHGQLVEKDFDKCTVCHENNFQGSNATTKIACGSCHPSSHGKDWQSGHPAVFSGRPQVSSECYRCHVPKTCGSCHPIRD